MLNACVSNTKRDGHHFELGYGDSIFVERTLAVYDAFVRSHMGDEMPTGEAWSRFFAENGKQVESTGELSFLMPDSTFVYGWTSDFVGGRLFSSLVTPRYLSPDERSSWPGGWNLQFTPRFVAFGKSLGGAWVEFADGVEAAGDISPTGIAGLVRLSEKINFDRREERFMTAIGFMNGCLDHRDFNLVKDVARNDSLKSALKIEQER
jgi:hypothetical protein